VMCTRNSVQPRANTRQEGLTQRIVEGPLPLRVVATGLQLEKHDVEIMEAADT
jgi:hypothetical protein